MALKRALYVLVEGTKVRRYEGTKIRMHKSTKPLQSLSDAQGELAVA